LDAIDTTPQVQEFLRLVLMKPLSKQRGRQDT
jgi:hypothetical protein